MLKSAEIRRQASQRLQEIFPRARGWEETPDARVGSQTADLLVKFRLGEHEQTLVVDVTSLGQPRQIRAAVTKLSELRRARDHGVTRGFIQRVKSRGYSNPSLDEVIRLRDRGLD